jgi:hypothetical protein
MLAEKQGTLTGAPYENAAKIVVTAYVKLRKIN